MAANNPTMTINNVGTACFHWGDGSGPGRNGSPLPLGSSAAPTSRFQRLERRLPGGDKHEGWAVRCGCGAGVARRGCSAGAARCGCGAVRRGAVRRGCGAVR
eukprot:scaffold19688_cov64-Phaeocystis_antarctica.AAC.2